MKAIDIVKIIYKYFPKKYALNDDYIGYGAGSWNSNVTKLLIAFEMKNDVIDFAIKNDCNMIITHHPMYWGATKKEILKSNPLINAMYEKLKKNKIANYSPHTAVDGAKNGLNHWYLKILAVDKIKWLKNHIVQIGYYKNGSNFNDIISKCKQAFQIDALMTNCNKEKIKSIMVASGSHGVETVLLAQKHNIDLLITGEMKHSTMLYADEINQKFLLVGHHMESIYAQKVKDTITNDLKIDVLAMPRKNIIKAV